MTFLQAPGRRGPSPSILRLIVLFREAMAGLELPADDAQLEKWAVVVFGSMSGRGRSFHTVDHVFDLCEAGSPLQHLAALFHDTIYTQVDGGIAPEIISHIRDAVYHKEGGFTLARFEPDDDELRAMLIEIFGMEQGQPLSPFAGLNEFLSALLALRCLQPAMPRWRLAQIGALIEATIPFRPTDEDGKNSLDHLRERMLRVDEAYKLGLGEERIEETMLEAVELANRDVMNFASEDTAHFLDNTWKLLPETNWSLRMDVGYTTRDYRWAIQKMDHFFRSLDPDLVFRSYHGSPSEEELDELSAKAAVNLDIASRYMRAKLAAAGLVEALALSSGGDAPISLFMGDLPREGYDSIRLDDFLEPEPPHMAEAIHPVVERLLSQGRTLDVGFDLQSSPISSFLYRAMGDEGIDRAASLLEDDVEEIDAKALLEMIPGEVLSAIIEACAPIAITRAEKLRALVP